MQHAVVASSAQRALFSKLLTPRSFHHGEMPTALELRLMMKGAEMSVDDGELLVGIARRW